MKYAGVHMRLRRVLGRANAHVCPCGRMADEWAQTTTGTDPRDYWPLCRWCHRKMDHPGLRSHCVNGHAYTTENTRSVKGGTARRCLACHRDEMRRYYARRRDG